MAPQGNRRAPVHVAVRYGTAELRPDPDRPQGWTLLVDGVPQSYVDLSDPGHLEFPYAKLLGRVVRMKTARHVLHLGGGALMIPRMLAHLRPRTEQLVIERDPELLGLVRMYLPYPDSIEVRLADARAALDQAAPQAYDLIVADAFQGAAMPATVGTSEFAAAARRALRPDGLLAMNLTDIPPLAQTRIQAATARSVFDEVALFGESAILRGRRAGNIILLAGHIPVMRSGKDERVVGGTDLAEFIGGAKARLDEPG
ncbi:fused MFS/spermidine synthase [Actinoplanes sp. TBRC 11911]|uniref:spermidine synthase n=1 Tax=Actinoplanes sp. TBRC 11911 TaxID=2729386 RepID=UPI00145DFFB0|nr:fused MFS/spermidine synthase [Actinoplanes sp. TBRC 11911]NMO55431.1 fused MFS/spermidine synthase [Actinoplanes sp. TBRC 11911]